MQIHWNGSNGMVVGEINPCSVYNPRGPSYVHLDEWLRRHYGFKSYDEYFNTMRDAYKWVVDLIPDAFVSGCVHDMLDGECKTISDLI